MLGVNAAAAVLIGLVLQGCATSSDTGRERQRAAKVQCAAGEILACDTSSSGRISDGRYGRNSGSRRRHCSCEPEHDLDALSGRGLPVEIN